MWTVPCTCVAANSISIQLDPHYMSVGLVVVDERLLWARDYQTPDSEWVLLQYGSRLK